MGSIKQDIKETYLGLYETAQEKLGDFAQFLKEAWPILAILLVVLHGVDEALGHLVGCPKHLRRFIIAKRLVEKPVSPGVNEVQMWLTLGKGASTRITMEPLYS